EDAVDVFCIEPHQQPLDRVTAMAAERQLCRPYAERLERAEQLCSAIGALGLLQRDSDPSLVPVAREQVIPLCAEEHLAKVHSERRGESREAAGAVRGAAPRLPP